MVGHFLDVAVGIVRRGKEQIVENLQQCRLLVLLLVSPRLNAFNFILC